MIINKDQLLEGSVTYSVAEGIAEQLAVLGGTQTHDTAAKEPGSECALEHHWGVVLRHHRH